MALGRGRGVNARQGPLDALIVQSLILGVRVYRADDIKFICLYG